MLALSSSTALAAGAVLTGCAALVTAYAALVKARGEARTAGDRACEERLRQAREDAARAWDALHDERRRLLEEGHDGD